MSLQVSCIKKLFSAGFLPALLFLSSCYTYRVATNAQGGSELSKPVTANAFFWGLVQKPPEIHTPICDSLGVNGMSEVIVKTNLGYAAITVFTLGIWCPVKIQWRCSKPCKKTGVL